MFRRIITIAFLYLKTTYSSRTTLIFSLAMPLLFTFVLGQAVNNDGPGEGQVQVTLAVVDEDRSDASSRLIDRLESHAAVRVEMFDRETALQEVEDVLSAALLIPGGFGKQLDAGSDAEVVVYQNANEISQAQLLLEAVNTATTELGGSYAAADLSARVARQVGLFESAEPTAITEFTAQAFTEAEAEWAAGAPVAMETATVSRIQTTNIPDGASQSSPGMLVMFALFFTFNGGATLLLERNEGTLRRLVVMPMGKGTIMAGKLLGIYLGSLVQMTVMVVVGQFFLGVAWGNDMAGLVVMLLAYGLAGTSLGLLLAALVRSAAQVSAAGTITMMTLASLGGAWWPIEIVPEWMQSLALFLPTGWAMRGFHDIITRGLDLSAVLLEAGVLLGFAALFTGIGVWRFRYE